MLLSGASETLRGTEKEIPPATMSSFARRLGRVIDGFHPDEL